MYLLICILTTCRARPKTINFPDLVREEYSCIHEPLTLAMSFNEITSTTFFLLCHSFYSHTEWKQPPNTEHDSHGCRNQIWKDLRVPWAEISWKWCPFGNHFLAINRTSFIWQTHIAQLHWLPFDFGVIYESTKEPNMSRNVTLFDSPTRTNPTKQPASRSSFTLGQLIILPLIREHYALCLNQMCSISIISPALYQLNLCFLQGPKILKWRHVSNFLYYT